MERATFGWRLDVSARGRMEASIYSRYPAIKVHKSAKKLSYELNLDVKTYECVASLSSSMPTVFPKRFGSLRMVPRSSLTGMMATAYALRGVALQGTAPTGFDSGGTRAHG